MGLSALLVMTGQSRTVASTGDVTDVAATYFKMLCTRQRLSILFSRYIVEYHFHGTWPPPHSPLLLRRATASAAALKVLREAEEPLHEATVVLFGRGLLGERAEVMDRPSIMNVILTSS